MPNLPNLGLSGESVGEELKGDAATCATLPPLGKVTGGVGDRSSSRWPKIAGGAEPLRGKRKGDGGVAALTGEATGFLPQLSRGLSA
mmetsp:Transcript_81622/g.162027  ORF Transcript_81622/g.162027 Transcript_81622/m.162027 type:complete len:87 (-) Transcript_81622:256-516(-)